LWPSSTSERYIHFNPKKEGLKMATTPSEIFAFLHQNGRFAIERHEISSAAFAALRQGIRRMFQYLLEEGEPDALEAAGRLRSQLSGWLTVPFPFDGEFLASLNVLGSPTEVGARWGSDVRNNYEIARQAAEELQRGENPARTCLRLQIRELQKANLHFKIYCHRTARPTFDSLMTPHEAPLGSDHFLHSVSDYRGAPVFDTLLKVGPLRSWGWGSIPDAITSAPRYGRLVQVVWRGCGDEPGFGYDPVAPVGEVGAEGTRQINHDEALVSRVSWVSNVKRFESDLPAEAESIPVEDDFQVFGNLCASSARRRAVLVHIGNHHGILYPSHSQVLSYDPDPNSLTPIWKRQPGESLREGMFVIRQRIDDVSFGGLKVEHDHYSQIWKSRLREEIEKDEQALVRRLRESGIRLSSLHTVIHNWCLRPTTVIHAPHSQHNFELLIKVLGPLQEGIETRHKQSPSWWQRAWNEIRHSRGDAIQAGLQEQEIVDDELCALLRDKLPELRAAAATKNAFLVALPENHSVHGTALFEKVVGIEDGFLAPESELKVVRETNANYQWRA
jgi:hypothetical protein